MCSRTTTESDIRRKVLPEYLHAAPLAILNSLCQESGCETIFRRDNGSCPIGLRFFSLNKIKDRFKGSSSVELDSSRQEHHQDSATPRGRDVVALQPVQ